MSAAARPIRRNVCMVTGASSGIGQATAVELCERGVEVVMVCRDPARGFAMLRRLQALREAPVHLIVADLASLSGVRWAARDFAQRNLPLHALINNAAVMPATRTLTEDGFETTFAVNYLAPFLLTQLLLDALRQSAPARVVNVATDAVRPTGQLDVDDLQSHRRYSAVRAYKQSKLALMLFTFELARRVRDQGIAVNCVHPGNVPTNMTARGFFIDLVRPLLPKTTALSAGRFCANLITAPELADVSGRYFEPRSSAGRLLHVRDDDTVRRLWEQSHSLISAAPARPVCSHVGVHP